MFVWRIQRIRHSPSSVILDRCLRHRGGEPDQAPEFHAGAYFVITVIFSGRLMPFNMQDATSEEVSNTGKV